MSRVAHSRAELLDWINSLLGIHYTKIEEVSNGAAFCQLMDVLFEGDVNLRNVNYNAHSETEMIANYKILQKVFIKHKIERNFPVDSLIKCKPMAALENLQWMREFFDQTFSGGEYDGPARRAETGCREPGEKGKRRRGGTSSSSARVSITTANKTAVAPTPASKPARNATTVRTQKVTNTVATNKYPTQTPGNNRVNTQQLQLLKGKIEELKNDNQILLEERNFYYQKLQKVEELCQNKEGDDFAQQILEVLYQTDEEHGFVSPDELDI
ncbi:Microtubule-associated protein RP/EB family member 2 [Tritrichomonas foetus]|uniref:Microtubule-associated protein RP/EB family member 2 n=1 Tax=Tritrichomonas foetus TaxID=1144522 RepID=A0A1J4KA98_9EUKA|nr:Microtubule-associated protein RP/EB family member 2 [Tritrichomonas foetus]|eukprot:OHT06590.1 Microtubule-associated protein RP/EB family member 2 [Tritrichomonas foetus]